MKMIKSLFTIICLFFSCLTLKAQPIPIDEKSSAAMLSPIGAAFNRIFNSGGLDSFYYKLSVLKKNKKGTVRVVNIGDSHIQSGHFPGYVRTSLQQFFGNAGRGLVFPLQVIQTNAPPDVSSSSNTGWKLSKVAGNGGSAGVSGF